MILGSGRSVDTVHFVIEVSDLKQWLAPHVELEILFIYYM